MLRRSDIRYAVWPNKYEWSHLSFPVLVLVLILVLVVVMVLVLAMTVFVFEIGDDQMAVWLFQPTLTGHFIRSTSPVWVPNKQASTEGG